MIRSLVTIGAAAALGAAMILPAGVAHADPTPLAAVQNWSAPGTVGNATHISGEPRVAFSGNGSAAVATWVEGSNCDGDDGCLSYTVKAAVAKVSGSKVTWASPRQLLSGYSRDPLVAINDAGTRATVLFHKANTGLFTRSATISGTTASWGSQALIDSNATDQPGMWGLAMSSNGEALAAVYRNNDQNEVRAKAGSVSGNTASWQGAAQTLFSGASYGMPSIALSPDGSAAIAGAVDGAVLKTKSAVVTGGGLPQSTWGSAQENTGAGPLAGPAALAVSNSGVGNATWGTSGSDTVVQSVAGFVTGTTHSWTGVSTLAGGDANNAATAPTMAVSDNGDRLTVAWTERDLGSSKKVASVSGVVADGSQAWGATVELTGNGQNASHPKIALSDDGTRATAAWFRSDGSNQRLYSASAIVSDDPLTPDAWGPITAVSTAGTDVRSWAPLSLGLAGSGNRALTLWQPDAGVPLQSAAAMVNVPGQPTVTFGGENQLTITPGANADHTTSYTIVYTTVSKAADPNTAWGIWAKEWPASAPASTVINMVDNQPIVVCRMHAVACYRPAVSGGVQGIDETRVYRVYADNENGRSAVSAQVTVTLSVA